MFKKWLSKLFTIGRGGNSSVTASDDLNWSPESVIPSPEDSQITEAAVSYTHLTLPTTPYV